MKNLSILLTLIIVLFSCTQKKEVDNIVDLTTLTEPDVTNLSELGSDITYIPLETNANFLLSQIDKLIYEGESWLILGSVNPSVAVRDKNAPPPPPMMPKRSVYRFSKAGDFICQISQQGGGPSEYRFIEEFLYNKSNNTVDIFSLGEIKEFSLDGKWIKNTTIENKEVTSLAYTNNQLLGFVYNGHGQSEYSFVLIDENGQTTNKYKNKYKFNVSTGVVIINPECIFYQYDGILHCKELNSDTIFSFDNGTFNPKYILKQGEAKYTTAVREKGNSAELDQYIIPENFFETNNYLFYQYRWKSRNNCLIQNKSNSTQYLIDNEMGLVNDLDNGPNFKIQNVVTIDDAEYLISWINAFELKTHINSEAYKNSTPLHPEKKKEMEQLANRMDENNNPVLVLVKLKK
ncbi:6-bladed beta-propeller [Draconibacterium orientale]|uniref:6-bladed beta-propeller n=1 Tax=Draconibacterium orientale TaxID=1168034 RepID=UPI0029C09E6E|nr:6-bladed beta-propeller [Draconibacterium orientale]